ncbi:MAG TPA: hypothetical protein PLB89_17630 [Flavobacteriales bacterium]|nr:hypothetical protein [Flavobacteriales bacterium]
MAQVFARITKAVGIRKPGQCRWVGIVELKHLDRDHEAVPPESEEAKAEIAGVIANIPGIALAPINGTAGNQFDIANPFQIDEVKGHLLRPRAGMADGRAVRWNFRERLLDIWKGRKGFNLPERKRVLHSFLKYHRDNGGNADAFVEYLGTVPDERWHINDMPTDMALAVSTDLRNENYFAPDLDKSLGDEIREWTSKAQSGAIMQGIWNGIRDQLGLPPLPAVMPPASSIWQGRSVVDTFKQLLHEAHYCLLTLLRDGADDVDTFRRKRDQILKGYRPDLKDYMATLGNQRRELSGIWYQGGGSPIYGLTLLEADNLGSRSDNLTQRWERWITVYSKQVAAALDAHGESEQASKEVGRLSSGIAQLSIGIAERATYEERLELAKKDLSNRGQHAAPGDIAAMFHGHIEGFYTWRERLLEHLGAVEKGGAVPVPLAAKMKVKAFPQATLSVPIIARLCWCMEKAEHADHGIVNATAALRLAKQYGQLHDRAGEKLKQERDRFDGADGKPYLKGGPRSREAYGRRTWAAVKAELDRLGHLDAAVHAEAILNDL